MSDLRDAGEGGGLALVNWLNLSQNLSTVLRPWSRNKLSHYMSPHQRFLLAFHQFEKNRQRYVNCTCCIRICIHPESLAMTQEIQIDPYSVAARQLQMRFNDLRVSLGTCCFWSRKSKTYLVTNWHNLSGKNALSNKHLSKTAVEPNIIEFSGFFNRELNVPKVIEVPLYFDGKRRWLEHPKFG